MSQGTVLVTGATGYIGFRVLAETLRAGYTVRAAVRSVAKAKAQLLDKPSIRTQNPAERLSFVEVPDITADGAYDAALAGDDVQYIIHVASPVPARMQGDAQRDLIDPAVKGTTSVLAAAAKAKAVRRVVITSSVVGNRSVALDADHSVRTTEASRIPVPAAPYPTPLQAYGASKIAALNASEAFVAEHRPGFDIVSVHPGFVIGPNELADDTAALLQGTATFSIKPLVGQPLTEPMRLIAGMVLVDDVAKLHVLALRPSVKGNQSFGAVLPVDDSKGAFGWLKEAYPDAVAKGVFHDGELVTSPFLWDMSHTVETFKNEFGFTFTSVKEATVRVAGQYLELWQKENHA